MWVPPIGQLVVAGLTLVSKKKNQSIQPTWLSELETLVLKGGKKNTHTPTYLIIYILHQWTALKMAIPDDYNHGSQRTIGV
jgi:hypothetical protein